MIRLVGIEMTCDLGTSGKSDFVRGRPEISGLFWCVCFYQQSNYPNAA